MREPKALPIGTLESVHRPAGGSNNSTMLFNIRTDNDLHPVDLNSILKCVKHAEQQETIPALPLKWWIDIWRKHGDLDE